MKKIFLYSLLGIVLAAPVILAQTNDGNLVGTVADASGAAIPNANVQLENTAKE